MNEDVSILTDKLYRLYEVYEKYNWNNPNRKIVIIFEENKTISFYVYDKEKQVDDFHFEFDDKEYDFYKAICLRLFVMTLGNVMIHKLDKDIYYNTKHKPYLIIVSKDKEMIKLIDETIVNQENEFINLDHKKVIEVSNNVKKRHLSRQLYKELDMRIALTEALFRGW